MDHTAFRVRGRTQILLTASEAYPALEKLFLTATTEIWASFLVFDLSTELRSDAAREIGGSWFDLIVHTLKRGVSVHFVISDFDPIARSDLHQMSWRSKRMFLAAAEMAGKDAKLDIRIETHAAETGLLPRIAVWPMVMHRLSKFLSRLNKHPEEQRDSLMRDMPGLRNVTKRTASGIYRVNYASLPKLYPAVHHQKIAVFDRKTVYIGGLDLDERRFDTPDHDRPGRDTWHDVQVITSGPIAEEVQQHLEDFLDVCARRRQPAPQRLILRTLSRRRRFQLPFFGPEPVLNEILRAHEVLISMSDRLIYLESQYFRDRGLAEYLSAAARRNPRLTLILVLPGAPEEVAFQNAKGLDDRLGEYLQARALRILVRAFGNRVLIASGAQQRRTVDDGRAQLHGAPLVYIHTKVSIFDETAAIVSSANLNGRSLKWDTEAGIYMNRPAEVGELRQRVMAHWLPEDAGPGYFDVATAQQNWFRLALANAKRPAEQRRGLIVPYDIKAAEKFGQSLPVLPDEMC
jgi:phosphatidylserine/phosphatidylglycerophosphate/cardiolipin synthase-like enzyme